MSLRDAILESSIRLSEMRSPAATAAAAAATPSDGGLKRQLHMRLLQQMDLRAIENMSANELRELLKSGIIRILAEDRLRVNESDLSKLVHDIQNEIIGLGPLETLLADPSISDILVNNYSTVYVERRGKLERADISFDSDEHLLKIIEKIVSRVGRRIDESSPMVDARLPDGSRVNAIIPPLALDGPSMSIRRFSETPLQMENLVGFETLTEEMALVIASLVKAKVNILISGGTGSGKTTLLNIMSGYIPDDERIITIEDAAELRLQQPHVVRLETRAANVEGTGEIGQRALVKNTLRMRPDRIVVGEVRGVEVLDMLQAMNTGHEGSLTTVHANTARDALTRLENMVGMAGLTVNPRAMRQQIVSAFGAVVQTARLSDGRRKVLTIEELTGMEGELITTQEIFAFRQTGLGPDGKVMGYFTATGVRPRFAEKLAARGAPLPESIFEPSRRP